MSGCHTGQGLGSNHDSKFAATMSRQDAGWSQTEAVVSGMTLGTAQTPPSLSLYLLKASLVPTFK